MSMLYVTVTLASVAAAYCLLGYWLAFGKQHWLVRAGLVCVALVLLVPIRAYEPLVFFAITSLVFTAAAGAGRLLVWWRAGERKTATAATSPESSAIRSPVQFRLHDLFGLMAIIGGGAWMLRTILREQVLLPWPGTLTCAVVAVAITWAVIGLIKGPKRFRAGAALILVGGIAVSYFYWLHRPGASAIRYLIVGDLGEFLFRTASSSTEMMRLLIGEFSFFLALGYGSARALSPKLAGSRRKRFSQGIGFSALAIWLLSMGWLYLQLLSFPHALSPDLTRANALPRIIERGGRIEFVPPNQARGIAAEVLSLSGQPGFVVVPWNGSFTERRDFEGSRLGDVQTCRSISRGLQAQAVAVDLANPDLAAEHLLGIVQIGDMLEHEGLLVHSLGGMNIEQTGHWGLVPLRTRISPRKARELIRELDRIEKQRETALTFMQRNDLWTNLNDRWGYRLYVVLVRETQDSYSRGEPGYLQYDYTRQRTCCCSRLLITDLAIRAYHSDHGEFPQKLEDLVPGYLQEIPNDLYADQPPVYRRSDSGFILYSVGSDGVDNGGTFSNVRYFTASGFDWSLESLTR